MTLSGTPEVSTTVWPKTNVRFSKRDNSLQNSHLKKIVTFLLGNMVSSISINGTRIICEFWSPWVKNLLRLGYLDLKGNPLSPHLEEAAGACFTHRDCELAATRVSLNTQKDCFRLFLLAYLKIVSLFGTDFYPSRMTNNFWFSKNFQNIQKRSI